MQAVKIFAKDPFETNLQSAGKSLQTLQDFLETKL